MTDGEGGPEGGAVRGRSGKLNGCQGWPHEGTGLFLLLYGRLGCQAMEVGGLARVCCEA